MNIAKQIVDTLGGNGHKWSVGGEQVDITEGMVQEVLDRLNQLLYDGDDLSQAQTGGVLMVKDGPYYGVYVYLGDYDGNHDTD